MNQILAKILSAKSVTELQTNFPSFIICFKKENQILIKLNKNIYIYSFKEQDTNLDNVFQVYHISHELKNYKILANYEYHEAFSYISDYISDNYGEYNYINNYPYFPIDYIDLDLFTF